MKAVYECTNTDCSRYEVLCEREPRDAICWYCNHNLTEYTPVVPALLEETDARYTATC